MAYDDGVQDVALSAADLWARVAELSLNLTRHPARHALNGALELLVESAPARAGLAIAGRQVVAERGIPFGDGAEAIRLAALRLAERIEDDDEVILFPDVTSAPLDGVTFGPGFEELGFRCAVLIPLVSGGRNHGAFCLWVDDNFETETESGPLLEHVGALFGVAFERDNRPESAEGGLLALGEMNRLASLGLALDSSLHALRTPSSSLVIQLDELRRQVSELTSIVDPSDALAFDALRDLQQTLDDMSVAATVVRKELTRLLDVAEPVGDRDDFQLSRMVHEAIAIARPELEQRGFTISEAFATDGTIKGGRRDALQLLLSVLFAMGKADSLGLRSPTLEVSVTGNEATRQVQVRTPSRDDLVEDLPPQLPEAALTLARKLGAYMEASSGAISISFHTHVEAPPTSPSGRPEFLRILIVDDDPMFARALRRALTPHEVRVSGTAGEAELLLLQGEFIPDLVVCDLWLPGKSGRTLHQRIMETSPAIASRFIFVSGAPLTDKDRAYFKDAGCQAMTKPVKIDELLAAAPR
jgi:CheY-like chemotaxis protein